MLYVLKGISCEVKPSLSKLRFEHIRYNGKSCFSHSTTGTLP